MINIAIDGPAGAGKSTIAKEIAKKKKILYIDTGAMYRAVALYAQNNFVLPTDATKVIPLLKDINIKLSHIDGVQHIFLNNKDVSTEIREHSMSKAASDISKIPEVRIKLVEQQRLIARENDVIMDGRDIGSYVLPNADKKFYLTATSEIRAKRRQIELLEKGENKSYQVILDDIITRDYNDMNRDFAPLIKTEDAILVDSSNMTIEEVIALIITYIK